MTEQDFTRFYGAIHGTTGGKAREPFPWQINLVRRLLRQPDGWPSVIAVPTASGKTSVLDAAVFILASQSELPERTARIRIFFVIDRRLVVDDVTGHAMNIAAQLDNPKHPIVEQVAHRLKSYGGTRPLAVATLRGGMYMDDAWAQAPNQPLIVVSTVDQIGSRLLFRGYGVSPKRRSVHAALVGCDSLVIVDEAHLSNPFLDTIKKVRQHQRQAPVALPRDIQLVEMTATPHDTADVLRLEEEDYRSPLGPRLMRPKIAHLVETQSLPGDAVTKAEEFGQNNGVVGIVLNTVAAARTVFERLKGPDESRKRAVLLTGRVRPWDRDILLNEFLPRMKVGRQNPGDLLFVIATQTVEVGADLDFDALVTEAAPLPSLRQRFGRLNRVGRDIEVRSVILKPREKKPSPIYGEDVDKHWAWLIERASDHHIDFSARAMDAMLGSGGPESLGPESGPLLFRAHINTWAQTNPEPSPDPDVAPFLHGAKALDAADVQLVWRRDLVEGQDNWVDVVSQIPPMMRESLPLPALAVRRWLGGQIEQPITDLESSLPPENENGVKSRPFLRWRGPDDSEMTDDLIQIRPGDTIIVPVAYGGVDEFGWNPNHAPAKDIADECSDERWKAGLSPRRKRWARSEIPGDHGPDVDDSELAELRELEDEGDVTVYQKNWFVAIKPKQKPSQNPLPDETPEETDQDENSNLTVEVTLAAHTAHVIDKTREFLRHSGLDAQLGNALLTAALHHDEGKRDVRFQMLLSPKGSSHLLAKGPRARSVAEFKSRARNAGYPLGARHEFASLALLDGAPNLPSGESRDLVAYLIGTHHGFGRALAPTWQEDTDIEFARKAAAYGALGSGWVDLFWKITRRYGWWGAAYLESILRLADCAASRDEEGSSRP